MSEEPLERSSTRKGLGSYSSTTGTIVFTGKPSTRTRLHELGHKKLGHQSGEMPLSQFVDQELEAEAFTYRHMDRPVTYRIAWPVISDLVVDFGLLPLQALGAVKRGLSRMGIKLSEGDSNELYSVSLMEAYSSKREVK